ncbi:LPXTG-motif cell wall anchor domain protein [Anaerococcus lactolyticus ATCC 51172]|uniref:LPXTG-motif cell wall anchor domain protein n=1 Tax=Anaerococcus lactolyticus ATCC 51172 TaxID=525254 RepID=C2BGP3_9FIRM|nr:SpaA isopeptide-forming pilin-related protein [Anaerococcus lactolyticus]EEI85889.1 LPXTG-motif cell wall anchor domain protein [Anaerococcus lactolyticus ATCC 51172]
MKGKISLLTRKIFATVIAVAMSIPPTAFANANEPVVYTENSSIMGIRENKEELPRIENTDKTKLSKDLGSYNLEIKANLDPSLTKINYTIKAKRKEKLAEDKQGKLSLSLTKTPSSNLNDLQLISANTENQTNEPDFKAEGLPSLVITSKAKDEIIYELSADVNKAKDQRSYKLILSLAEEAKSEVLAYNLKVEKGLSLKDGQEVETVELVNEDDESPLIKGEYKKEGILGGLFASQDSITWEAFILNEEENQEITYDFNLDKNQDPTNSKIAIDYYEPTDKGFEIKREFSQTIDFAKKIKFEIPKGHLAKLTLKTKVSKKNTKVKSYSLNNGVVKNPIYIEGNEEEKSNDDEEPAQKEENKKYQKDPTDKGTVEVKPSESNVESNPGAKPEGKDSQTQIVATDSSGKEIKIEEKNQPVEENKKPKISALILNRDSLIARLKAENKLTNQLETAIADLADILNSYNEERITDQDLKDFTKSLAERNQLAKADLKSYLEAILSGLNKQTNKAANINYDEIITYAYPEKKEAKPQDKKPEAKKNEGQKAEEKPAPSKESQEHTPPVKKEEPKANQEDKPLQNEKSEAVKTFDKDLASLKEEAKKEPAKKSGIFEGLKSLLGQTDLQKADRELKKALADKKNTLADIQKLLDSFKSKYNLSKADQAKLMDDNGDAIRALIEKTGYTGGHVFAVRGANQLTDKEKENLKNKKFTVLTRFNTSNAGGAIQDYQYFDIHLDNKLTVKDPSSLEDIKYNGRVIAKPKYINDKGENKIRYNIQGQIPENISILLKIPVDYNTDNITTLDQDGNFTVINKVSGMGVKAPKDLLPQKVDRYGNLAGTIIEPGRGDVPELIESDDKSYKVDMDAYGIPNVVDGELKGFSWKATVLSTVDLKGINLSVNFTTVKGSGLGEIQNLTLDGANVKATSNNLKDHTGIVDSINYKPNKNTRELNFTFYTPVINKQESYMLDLNAMANGKVGAKRVVGRQGYPKEKVEVLTPSRVGMNNRTSILGEFPNQTEARWTITDQVSTGDDGKLPLESRQLAGGQSISSGKVAVYGVDTKKGSPTYGQMIQVGSDESVSSIPDKETKPQNAQPVGSIVAYEYTTNLDGKPASSIGGVVISKNQDIHVDQYWGLEAGINMPAQTIKAVNPNKQEGQDGYELGHINLEQGSNSDSNRQFTIQNVKVWNIDDSGNATRVQPAIKQDLPKEVNGHQFVENYNYYRQDLGDYYIHNRGVVKTEEKFGNFTLHKVGPDKEDVPNATFRLFRGGEAITNSEGKAEFKNIKPGTYYLTEIKAPPGYKLAEDTKIVVEKNGKVRATGPDAKQTGDEGATQYFKDKDYPLFMNLMSYATKGQNGEVTTYIYLKPDEGGGTNQNTRLSITGYDNSKNLNVEVYDVGPSLRSGLRQAMELQTGVEGKIAGPVLNQPNRFPITGDPKVYDTYTQKTGYQIKIPHERFGTNWGFLVKVKGTPSTSNGEIGYDWLVDNTNPGNNSKIQKTITPADPNVVNKTTVTVKDEKFETKPIEVIKVTSKKETLGGATFVLKNPDTDEILKTVKSVSIGENKGKVDFDKMPPGDYIIEEVAGPEGYIESQLVFDVHVDEASQVTYKPRFKNGVGTPVAGVDYWIEDEVIADEKTKVDVVTVNQSMTLSENNFGETGIKEGVWEAYRYESYTYKANIKLSSSEPGKRFEIQFDPKLDFTQYVNQFPEIKNNGQVIAKPYFNYDTNLLTYVFTEASGSGEVIFDLVIDGVIPSKFYAKNNGDYEFTNVVAPGQNKVKVMGNQVDTVHVKAFYEDYDSPKDGNAPPQAYYFREVYKEGEDWYVKAIAYYNPKANAVGNRMIARTFYFNWMSTDWQSGNIANWVGRGYKTAFKLQNVKVYSVQPTVNNFNQKTSEPYMPLSMGIRPENDPSIYRLELNQDINDKYVSSRQGSIGLTYDENQLSSTGALTGPRPLQIDIPAISKNNEGYVIDQTFKVTDLNTFRSRFRAFVMQNSSDTKNSLKSAFASKVNVNEATAEQNKKEIPKFYKQKVMMANEEYVPTQFKIRKYNEADKSQNLAGAIFTLTNMDTGKSITKKTGKDGYLTFDKLQPGVYRLKETEAPKDFIKSDKRWLVNVAKDGIVTITEVGFNSDGTSIIGKDLTLEVANKPEGQDFVVYKKGDQGQALAGAKFVIKKKDGKNYTEVGKGESDSSGLVKFKNNTGADLKLIDGIYTLEETDPPTGYKKLDKKWVLVVKDNKVKVYDYIEGPDEETSSKANLSLLNEEGTHWVDMSKRSPAKFSGLNDPRWKGYINNSPYPYKLGTRIIGINKGAAQPYVIQRFVINPEAKDMGPSKVQIHRQPLNLDNSDWYQGSAAEAYKVFKLDKAVTENVEDIKLEHYVATELNLTAKKVEKQGEVPERMEFDLPETDKPIIIDVKVPYKNENGGVGLGIDYWENVGTYNEKVYWKPDFYESVTDIPEGDEVTSNTQAGNIIGAYVSEGSLDVANERKRHKFEFTKVRETSLDGLSGATFKLTGTKPVTETKWGKSDKDGKVSFKDLLPGSYKLEEHGAPQGYEGSNTDWTVTILEDGKVYIKDNNPSNTVPNKDPEAQWQKVDVTNTNKINKSDSVRDEYKQTADKKIKTHIVRINKATNRIRQVYVLNRLTENLLDPTLELHSYPEKWDITDKNTNVMSVTEVGNDASPENLGKIGANVQYSTEIINKNNHTRLVIKPKISGEKTIAVVIETDLKDATEIGGIGTGMDYDNQGNQYWGAEKYASLDDFVLAKVEHPTVDKNTKLIIDGKDKSNDAQNLLRTANEETPALLARENGIIARNYAFRSMDNDVTDLSGPLSSLEARSASLNSFRSLAPMMARSIAPRSMTYSTRAARAPRAADVWEKVDQNRSINRTTSNRATDNQTRITEINKGQGKYRQIFLVNKSGSGVDSPRYKFHSEPLGTSIIGKKYYGRPINFKVLSIRPVLSSSTIDNIQYDGNQTLRYNSDEVIPDGQYHRFQFRLATNDKRPIAIEVEYDYPKTGGEIGLGMDYYPSYRSNGVWAAEKYGSADDINCKHSVRITQPNEATIIPSSTLAKKGTKIDLTISPKTGYEGYVLDSLTVTDANGQDVTVTGTSFEMPDTDVTVMAVMKSPGQQPKIYDVTVIGNISHGKITPNVNKAKAGDEVTVNVEPDPGYKLASLVYEAEDLLDPVPIVGNKFIMPKSNVRLNATFEKSQVVPQTYKITTIKTTGGSIIAQPNAKANETVRIQINPGVGNYSLVDGQVDVRTSDNSPVPVSYDDQGPYFTMPASDVTVSGQFQQADLNNGYVVRIQDTANGRVTASQYHSWPGKEITLTPSPEPGYKLKSWFAVSNGSRVQITDNKFKMPDGEVYIIPTFERDFDRKYTIGTDVSEGGTATPTQSSATAGQPIGMDIRPEEGYRLESVNVIDENEIKVAEYNFLSNSFSMPAKNVIVKVTFKKIEYTITKEQTEGGTVSIDKSKATKGETVTITVTPKEGYEVGQVKGDNIPINLVDGKYPFKMPARDVTIRVTFNKKEVKPKVSYFVGVDGNNNGKKVVVYTRTEPNKSEAGKLVEFTVTPFDDYEITSVYVRLSDGSGRNVEPLKQEGNKYSFIMPNQAVTIYANVQYVQPPEGTLLVGINPNITNGSVTTNPRRPYPNDKVRITATPKQDYSLESLSVTKQWGGNVDVQYDNEGPYFIMPAENVTVYATFRQGAAPNPDIPDVKPDDNELGYLIYDPSNPNKIIKKKAMLTNRLAGLELKVYKKNINGRTLEGGEFKLIKTEADYKTEDKNFTPITAVSGLDGRILFKDKDNQPVKLQKGYYVLEEINPPLGYKKASSKWKIEVKDDQGKMHATYFGPSQTPSQYLLSTKSKLQDDSTATNLAIRTASKITHIDPDAKTFVQRVIIDLRGYTKKEKVNVQITPKYKRVEKDRPGVKPDTIEEGLKTAYRTTYKISNPATKLDTDYILGYYDLSKKGVSMVNTARWRPFDWGFDEDQLNLDPGEVYFIDIEGYYDESLISGMAVNEKDVNGKPVAPHKNTKIKPEDLAKLEMDIKFYEGARNFYQAIYNEKTQKIEWKTFPKASYQAGAAALANIKEQGWLYKPYNDRYENWVGLEGGKILPEFANETPLKTLSTKADISDLYTTDNPKDKLEIPKEGLDIINDEETYNITFSKHGRDGEKSDGWESNGKKVTENRLEGAIFKLQQYIQNDYVDVPGSYVSSAFNGYFGFRGLKPGRYRLVEVEAPKGYRPIRDAILYMTVSYEEPKTNVETGEITKGRGRITLEYDNGNGIIEYNPAATTVEQGKLVDYVTSATAKNMGKIINEKPGQGKVRINKEDGEGHPLEGAKFRLTRLGTDADTNPDSTGNEDGGYIATSENLNETATATVAKKDEVNPVVKNGKVLTLDPVRVGAKKINGETISNAKVTVTFPGGKTVEIKTPNSGKFTVDVPRDIVLKENDIITASINELGVAIFDKLPIGNYILEEIESPKGHKSNGQKWRFTVGGDGLDPYVNDTSTGGKDLTDKINLDDVNIKVQKTLDDDKTDTETSVHPHKAQSIGITAKFKVPVDQEINPGDHFTVKLTKSVDLYGIYKDKPLGSLDIFADGVGTIAKAKYDKQNSEITYTFTEYAKTYTLTEFKTNLATWINLDNIKKSTQNVEVGIGLKGKQKHSKNYNVVYDIPAETSRHPYKYTEYYRYWYGTDYQTYNYWHNLTGKITEMDKTTGEFTQYYYINRMKDKGWKNWTFRYNPYSSDKTNTKRLSYANVRVMKLKDNSDANIARSMPESFALDINNDSNLTEIYNQRFDRMGATSFNFSGYKEGNQPNGYMPNAGSDEGDSYIVEVKGKIPLSEIKEFESVASIIVRGYTIAARWDLARFEENKAVANAQLIIQAINPKNEIKFKKQDVDGKALVGAKFALYKKNGDSWQKTNDPVQTTKEDGLISYEKLGPGDYALVEEDAPDGYNKIEGHAAEFNVSELGIITRKVKKAKPVGNAQGDTSETPAKPDEYIDELIGDIPVDVVNFRNVDFVKLDKNDKTKKLANAKFAVYYKQKENDTYQEYKEKTTENNEEVEKPKVVSSDKDGKFKLELNKNGYYALKEIDPPSGYARINDFIHEFMIKDGRTLAKVANPLKSSYYKSGKGYITSEVLSVDKDKKTFKQRLIINPDHKELTMKEAQSYLRIMENGWEIKPRGDTTKDQKGGKIMVAVLKKDGNKTIDGLEAKDFAPHYAARSGPLGDNIGSRYSLRELYGLNKDGEVSTTDSLVVEYTGKLKDESIKKDEKTQVETLLPVDQLEDVILDYTVISELKYKLDLTNLAKEGPAYVDVNVAKTSPTEIENEEIHKIKFRKIDAIAKEDGTKTPLEGAEFELWYKEKEGDKKVQLHLYQRGDEKMWFKDGETVPQDYTGSNDKITSPQDGIVELDGLYKPGYYFIKEVKAPKGYSLPLTEDKIVKEFVIKKGKVYQKDDLEAETKAKKPMMKVTRKKENNNVHYTFEINPEGKAVANKDARLIFENAKLGSPVSLKVTYGNASEELSTDKFNGVIDLSKYFLEINKDNPSTSRTKITIDYVAHPSGSEDITVKSVLKGVDDTDIEINDTFSMKALETTESPSQGKSYVYKPYEEPKADNSNLVEIENRKVELPKARGVGDALTYTLAGLAVMLLGIYVYYRKKKVVA